MEKYKTVHENEVFINPPKEEHKGKVLTVKEVMEGRSSIDFEVKTNLERLSFPELVEEFSKYYRDIPMVKKEEKLYSEEDMRKSFCAGFSANIKSSINDAFEKWFEKFKK